MSVLKLDDSEAPFVDVFVPRYNGNMLFCLHGNGTYVCYLCCCPGLGLVAPRAFDCCCSSTGTDGRRAPALACTRPLQNQCTTTAAVGGPAVRDTVLCMCQGMGEVGTGERMPGLRQVASGLMKA